VRTPGRYRDLTEGDREPQQGEGLTAASRRREDLKAAAPTPEYPAAPVRPAPSPAPRPGGMLDPDRTMRDAEIQALNDMARSGKIDWAEWGRRVRDIYEKPPVAARTDELAEARAVAAEVRAREQVEAAQQRTAQRER
jgi:hypothetical protein